MSNIKYKPEIDGLRTLAVFSVIIYHINPLWLPSGFVGVDIFLVISGFLITNIILKSNESKSFSVIDFYSRRVKRIIPLTYLILTVILTVGWFLSYPAIYRAESNSVLSALYFLANIRFSLMGNYFNSADDNPLLHLWSLSLEEQFYFIWPIFIWLFYRFKGENKLLASTILLILISLSISYFFVNNESLRQYAYFILPTRMTGLLFGAALAFISYKNKNNLLSVFGFLLMVLSLFYIEKSNFPSYAVLVPLIGSSIIIMTPDSTFTKLFFSNKITNFFGKISFSLYMWHWPLLVFSKRYIENNNINIEYGGGVYVLFYFLILVGLSVLSYKYIETIFRNVNLNNKKVFLLIFILPLLILSSCSLYISKTNGIPIRYGLTDKMTRTETLECYGSLMKDYCYLNKGENRGLLLIGDSHAGSMNHFVKKLAVDKSITAYDASSGGCNFYSSSFKSTQCENVKLKIDKVINSKNVDYLFIAKRFDGMTEGDVSSLIEYVKQKTKSGFKVVLLKQVPKLNDVEYLDKKYMNKYLSGKMEKKIDLEKLDINYEKYNDIINLELNGNKNVFLLELSSVFCRNNLCNILDENGFPLYYDDDHLSAYGAEWAYDEFKNTNQFKDFIYFLNKTI
ncbi:acyltransferase family protein [Vibrio alginolyticus]|uniref:acyltransferase family protein n=1 Tax=Vibrio alginolyticus TaxID=663 RepID=UPI00211A616C|nr:acyltransferase family protein [Vibrio alginolyticus]MCQ9104486.1 acyltransferase [Vibrio alginolyticus]